MNIGFTGTKDGLTQAQHDALFRVFFEIFAAEQDLVCRHGDCIGADASFDALCATFNLPVVIHPGYNSFGDSPTRAYCGKDRQNVRVLHTKPYLDRDDDIAAECGLLIACPKEKTEQLRSGTWATVRRAIKRKKPVVVVYPDGEVELK